MTRPKTADACAEPSAFRSPAPSILPFIAICTDCRKTTGSAFAISFPIDAKHFTITSGEPKAYATLSDHGNTITRHFCLSCGSPIYTEISSHPERVYVKAGAMDNPDIIHPEMEIWTASRVDWATPSDDLMSFREERTPPSSKT
ncbi:GFA family protein [uncultured Cohaesibacter sp.]|uniref:GFA family protein n=1 Tax=uncultured Cohaesibacter sp. TaxID=1002546 RepID=UPI0029C63E4A|nr:GFA family protein [uncultured Cohaesibacter sp.]